MPSQLRGPILRGIGPSNAASSLIVEFCGEEHTVDAPDDLSFGRDADLVIGEDNQFVHRLAGRFHWQNELWWIQNLGTRLTLQLLDANSDSRLVLRPGSDRPLAVAESVLTFVAGKTTYEMSVRTDVEFRAATDLTAHPPEIDGRPTMTASPPFELNDEQRLLIVSLAEPRLLNPHDHGLPSNKDVYRRLDWSKKKFDGKLDYLCRRLDEIGIPGLRGDVSSLARDRRAVLVDYMLDHRMVTEADLPLLDD